MQYKTGDQDYGRTYATRCRRKGNGKYKASKTLLVSDAGTRAREVDVAYNPEDDSYVITWGASHEVAGKIYTVADIYSRKVSAQGKLVGGINKLTSSDDSDSSPAVQYLPTAESLVPSGTGSYLLIYKKDPSTLDPGNSQGVYSAVLDANGSIVSGPKLLRKSPTKNMGFSADETTYDLVRLEDGGYVLGLVRAQPSGYYEALVMKIDEKGKFVKEVQLDGEHSTQVEVIQLSKRLCLASWARANDYPRDAINRRFLTKLKLVKKEFRPLEGQAAYPSRLVKLGDGRGGYQISRISTHDLIGRNISTKGKLADDTDVVLPFSGAISSFDAVGIPVTDDIFVAWSHFLRTDFHRLKGFVFSADK